MLVVLLPFSAFAFAVPRRRSRSTSAGIYFPHASLNAGSSIDGCDKLSEHTLLLESFKHAATALSSHMCRSPSQQPAL